MAYHVILDSGHAKVTAGKRSPDGGLLEWEFNNDMQYRIKKRLEQLGIVVYLVNPNPESGSEVSLASRVSRANNYWADRGKPSTLYVSLHANAAGGGWSSARGVEVYSASSCSSNSDKAAKIIDAAIYKDVKAIDSGFRDRGHKKANYYVIRHTNMPGCLIEYEFYSNQSGVSLLKNRRDVLTESTVKGICQYFGVTYKAGSSTPTTPPSTGGNTSSNSGGQKYGNGTYNKDFKVITPGSTLTVRSARPDSKGKLGPSIGSLADGTIIRGGYCLNNWMGVIYNGKQGFVSAEYLSMEVPQVPQVPSTAKPFKNGTYKIKAKVTADVLNVRKGRPGQSGYNTIADKLTKGEIVEVDYCLNGWFSIYECNSAPGFISGDYIQLILN